MIDISDEQKAKWKEKERYIQARAYLSYYIDRDTTSSLLPSNTLYPSDTLYPIGSMQRIDKELLLYNINTTQEIDITTSSIPNNQITLKVDNENGEFDEFSPNSILQYLQKDASVSFYITIDEDYENKILICTMDFDNVKTNEDLTATITCNGTLSDINKIPFRVNQQMEILYNNLLIEEYEQGSGTASSNTRIRSKNIIPIVEGRTYVLTAIGTNASNFYYVFNTSETLSEYPFTTYTDCGNSGEWSSTTPISFTATKSGYLGVIIRKPNNTATITPSEFTNVNLMVVDDGQVHDYIEYGETIESTLTNETDELLDYLTTNYPEIKGFDMSAGAGTYYENLLIEEYEQGRSADNSTTRIRSKNLIPIVQGKTYVLTWEGTNASSFDYVINTSSTRSSYPFPTYMDCGNAGDWVHNSPISFTATQNGRLAVVIRKPNNAIIRPTDFTNVNLMVVDDGQVHPYTPYGSPVGQISVNTRLNFNYVKYETLYDVLWTLMVETSNGFWLNDRFNHIKLVNRRDTIKETITKEMQIEKAKLTKENEFNKAIINNYINRIATSYENQEFKYEFNGDLIYNTKDGDTPLMEGLITTDDFDLSLITINDFVCTNCTMYSIIVGKRYVYYKITGNENDEISITITKTLPKLVKEIANKKIIGTNSDNFIELNDPTNVLQYNYYDDIINTYTIALKVETKIMGLPYLELGDVVAIETDYGEKIVNITKLNYSYDGGLTCDIEGYSTDYDGLFPSDTLYPSDNLYPNARL